MMDNLKKLFLSPDKSNFKLAHEILKGNHELSFEFFKVQMPHLARFIDFFERVGCVYDSSRAGSRRWSRSSFFWGENVGFKLAFEQIYKQGDDGEIVRDWEASEYIQILPCSGETFANPRFGVSEFSDMIDWLLEKELISEEIVYRND
jgi:hypothetical protein